MPDWRTAVGGIIGAVMLALIIWASPRCGTNSPDVDRCQDISRQGLPVIVKDSR